MKTIATPGSILAVLAGCTLSAQAQSYAISYTDGGTWSTVYAQGFSTSLGATPAPGVADGTAVDLTQFQFFKSGDADSAANIQLAIFNTMYPDTTGLTTGSSSFVGLSDNTIASTGPIATGSPIIFTFGDLQLSYGNDYSAYFVNVGAGGTLTPVLVSALTANYVLESDGNYHPASNYGTESQYQYTTGNYISGGYLNAFSYAGDADFSVSITAVPEPTAGALLGLGALWGGRRILRRG
ncbi:MAG: PEP-CTERM sorting domain-containing protein [Verrucomicrobiota bacterium]